MNKIILISMYLCCSLWAIGQTNVQWTNMINTTASGNTLTKTGINGWNAGASSVQQLPANSNGYCKITISQDNTHRFFGLSVSDESTHFTDIDYAIFLLSNKTIRIYEEGSYKGSFDEYAIGDRLEVERIDGLVRYKKNGLVFYTSDENNTGPLVVDATIYHQGGTIENAVLSFGTDGSCTDNDGDGICAADDCNDNNSNVPTSPGTACNDNNSNTSNDVIQSDGCTCQGVVVSNCGTPTNLSASSSSNGSITFSWSNEQATTYQMQYRKTGSSWTTTTPSINQYTATGLTAGNYDYRVRANCGGSFTSFTSLASFTLTDNTETPNNGLWTESGNKIYHTGKVLIGPSATTVPGNYNLYVTEGILSERVRVTPTTGNWADYVFEKDYPLNSIQEVAQHIQTKKHLPNVPSAATVEKEGIDLGTMDATLLRQIEELWLHTIELNKKVKLLEDEIKKLRSEE